MIKYHLYITLVLYLLTIGVNNYSSDVITLPGTNVEATVGYADNSQLKTKIHFVYVPQPQNSDQRLTLWINGGPGCSSKYGLIQQIGPNLLGLNAPYEQGQDLIQNKYSWLKYSSLLFFDTPAGVGYSIVNQPQKYQYNDENSAKDTFNALLDFMTHNQQLSGIKLFLAGQSYAGKFISDLAVKINYYNLINPDKKINLKGILIANGVMRFEQGSLQNSRISYMIDHNFIDPKLLPYWENSCQNDPDSAGCRFFQSRYQDLLYRTNPYNIYGLCSNKTKTPTQASILSQFSKKYFTSQFSLNSRYQYCSTDEGTINYFKINKQNFKSKSEQEFELCGQSIKQNYRISPEGVMDQLPKIISNTNITIHYMSGNWDNVVPFTDTIKNLQRLGLIQESIEPWLENNQNVGMKRTYIKQNRKITFWMIKKAGHTVSMYPKQYALKIFKKFIDESQNNI